MTRQPARGIDRLNAARLASCAETKKADTIMRTDQNTVVIHRFGIGKMVRFSATLRLPNAAGGTYRVVAQLPQRDGEFQYPPNVAFGRFEKVLSN
jgi:hypothetical protein